MMTVSNVSTLASQQVKSFEGDKANTFKKVEKASVTVELSEAAHKYLSKGITSENTIAKNVDYKEESINFSKNNINNYSGSFSASQANTHFSRVASLTA
jgi:hypothetical protein